jgi:hypothetical protein
MNARDDDGFLNALRALPVRGRATVREVTITAADIRRVNHRAARRRQGLPASIRDTSVIGRVVALVRGGN